MERRSNIIYIALTLIFIILFIIMWFVFENRNKAEMEMYDDKVAQYNQRQEKKLTDEEKKAERDALLLAEVKGIACWGDGFTYGTNGMGVSYPGTIDELVKNEDYPYPVVNLGVYGEDSLTVLGRSGAIPFITKYDFTIEGNDTELIELGITSENGEEVNPCIREYNPGFNPCVIAGVKCVVYGATLPDDINKASTYYFNRRDSSTKVIDVPAGTEIVTSGSTDYKDYINILQIGDSGGYKDDDELIEQSIRFAESLGDSDNYIIIGRIGGSDDDNEYYDEAMEEEFGVHYVNIRKALTGSEREGVVYNDNDRIKMKKGLIPDCLKSGDYFNSRGYRAVGEIIYEKIKELGMIGNE